MSKLALHPSLADSFTNYLDSRILIVDDMVLNRELILTYLQNAGFRQLDVAEDGDEAIEKIHKTNPDLMILDLVMPRMNGVSVIQQLRSEETTKQLPIIVQTMITEPEERVKAWQSGATDVITKPIHRLELLSRVKVQLENTSLIRKLLEYQTTAQTDIQQALDVQKSLLPSQKLLGSICDRHHVKIESLYVPSRFLSGDIWGIIEINPRTFGVWICDFAGKGIRASLNTFRIHTLIQEFKHLAYNPPEFVYQLNNKLKNLMPSGQFATFLMGIVNLDEEVFSYAAASSTHPLIYHPDQKDFTIGDGTGLPIGVTDDITYDLRSLPFPKNSSLILYSDLFWEEKALPGISLLSERLKPFAKELNGHSVIETIKEMVNLLGDSSFVDDLTLIEISKKA
jgi:sigma-B regulation protein RsbU (phosphoserine phosphatase)